MYPLRERGAGVVRGVQVRAPGACASSAPRLTCVRRLLAIERPLTAPPEPPPPTRPESQVSRPQVCRSRWAPSFACRAFWYG